MSTPNPHRVRKRKVFKPPSANAHGSPAAASATANEPPNMNEPSPKIPKANEPLPTPSISILNRIQRRSERGIPLYPDQNLHITNDIRGVMNLVKRFPVGTIIHLSPPNQQGEVTYCVERDEHGAKIPVEIETYHTRRNKTQGTQGNESEGGRRATRRITTRTRKTKGKKALKKRSMKRSMKHRRSYRF